MPKVYVVSNNGFDLTNAEKFGEVIYLTSGFVDVHKDYDKLKEKLTNILKDATPDDYLLLVGVNLLCVMAYEIMSNAFASKNLEDYPKAKLLHWNSKLRDYSVYQL
jgi:hypothetical protein